MNKISQSKVQDSFVARFECDTTYDIDYIRRLNYRSARRRKVERMRYKMPS